MEVVLEDDIALSMHGSTRAEEVLLGVQRLGEDAFSVVDAVRTDIRFLAEGILPVMKSLHASIRHITGDINAERASRAGVEQRLDRVAQQMSVLGDVTKQVSVLGDATKQLVALTPRLPQDLAHVIGAATDESIVKEDEDVHTMIEAVRADVHELTKHMSKVTGRCEALVKYAEQIDVEVLLREGLNRIVSRCEALARMEQRIHNEVVPAMETSARTYAALPRTSSRSGPAAASPSRAWSRSSGRPSSR